MVQTSSLLLSDRKSTDDWYDIPRGEAGKQLVDQLSRNVMGVSAGLQQTLRQMTHLETRIGHEISSLSTCLQENMSRCTTSHAPHEEQLMQLDGAKRKLKQLTRLLEARSVFDSTGGDASLRDRPVDDSLLPTLVAIGDNLNVIKEFGAKPKFDVETYHTTKDRYLTWKGTEFAVKFGTPDGLEEIFDAFRTLNSLEDFYRLYQHHFDQSLTSLVNRETDAKSLKEIGGIFVNRASDHFRIHMSSLCKYCDEAKAFSTLLDAWKNFVKNNNLEKIFERTIENNEDYDILNDLKLLVKSVENMYGSNSASGATDEDSEKTSIEESPQNIERIIVSGLVSSATKPITEKLKTMVEAPPLNFRSVAEVSTSLEKFAYLLNEISSQILAIYDAKSGPEFVVSIIKPMFTDYTMRLGRMEDNTSSKVRVEDYLERISLAGQLNTIISIYKDLSGGAVAAELRTAKKWMSDRVKDALRASHRFVTDKMPNHGSEVYKDETEMAKSAVPTPQDFVVTATQNLLQLLRLWEEALANSNTKLALSIYFTAATASEEEKLSMDEEAIFAAVLDKIAGQVVKKLLQSIDDVIGPSEGAGPKKPQLTRGLVKELLCDSEYLRDALIDLRAGTHSNLDDVIEKLRTQLNTMS